VAPALQSGQTLLLSLGLIVISGFLPALLYSFGLRGVEAGKGAVMASIEPVVASLAGFLFFGETPTPLGILGIVLVLGAVVILNLNLPVHSKTPSL
jgi:drug/metabolite transporter (DMT)-like permease